MLRGVGFCSVSVMEVFAVVAVVEGCGFKWQHCAMGDASKGRIYIICGVECRGRAN